MKSLITSNPSVHPSQNSSSKKREKKRGKSDHLRSIHPYTSTQINRHLSCVKPLRYNKAWTLPHTKTYFKTMQQAWTLPHKQTDKHLKLIHPNQNSSTKTNGKSNYIKRIHAHRNPSPMSELFTRHTHSFIYECNNCTPPQVPCIPIWTGCSGLIPMVEQEQWVSGCRSANKNITNNTLRERNGVCSSCTR